MFNMLIYCTSLGSPIQRDSIHNSYGVQMSDPDKGIAGTPIEHIWGWTAECSKINKGGIGNLLIACHGRYEGNEVVSEKGGWGIRLGTGLDHENVKLTRQLKGLVKNIYLYVCSGAQQPDPKLLSGDKKYNNYAHNRETCILMAEYTKCNVYASIDVQSFNMNDRWNFTFSQRFNFGKWEGKVEKFMPGRHIVDVTNRMQGFGNETGDE